jgi:copper transport protein
MRRRALLLAAAVCALGCGDAWAHASLERSDPVAGATLGAAPRLVRLTFTERPDPSQAAVRILDAAGRPVAAGPPLPVAGDPRTLAVGVPPLDDGVVTVRYRVLSAGDGHVVSGVLTFGVRVTPGAAAVARSAGPPLRPLELGARVLLVAGLVMLLGAAVAAAAGFGGTRGSDLRLAVAGWLAAAAGVVLLAETERRAAGTSLADLLATPTGHGLLWRGGALAATGTALVLARRLPELRRPLLAAAAAGTLGAMGVHIAAGHAGTDAAHVAFGLVHAAAAGVWAGGLTALLLGVRGAPSPAKAAAVRRFARLAGAALALVVATGVVRAVDELPRPGDLVASDYGLALVAKMLLVLGAVGLAWRNRTRSLPAVATDLRPLRQTSRVELGAAGGALLAAGALGAIAPPVHVAPPEPGLVATGPGGVRLTAASAEPGPNTFAASVAAGARDVRLRFASLDDPDVRPVVLRLRRGPGRSFVGTGEALRFDGRWRVDVLVDRRPPVPLVLAPRAPAQFVSVLRVPGRPPQYTRLIRGTGFLRVTPHERGARRARVVVSAFDIFENEARVRRLLLTATHGRESRRTPVRRIGAGRFVAHVEPGPDRLAVVAVRTDGTRMRSTFTLG